MKDGLDLEHLQRLAALSLPPEQHAPLREALGRILAHIDLMESVDTEGVEPTVLGGGSGQPLREDQNRASLPVVDALAQAPAQEDGCFVVPPILASDETA